MKITDLKCTYLEVPLAEKIRTVTRKDRDEHFRFTLVKVFTDEGIVGIGAQDAAFPEWGQYVERSMKPFLLEQVVEPFYVEKLNKHLGTLAFGTGLSPRPVAIEMALWDAIGKKTGQPLYKLLGAYQDKVRAYASVHEEYPLWKPEEWVPFTERILNDGFTAIKLHIGYIWSDPQKIINVIKMMRDELGYDYDIMIDAMQAWTPDPIYDLTSAIEYARGCERYECAWLEEPLPHFNNPELGAQLCETVDIPIAGGGAMFGIHTYKTVLEKGALDIVQPDVWHTGISEVKKIAVLAEQYGRQCVPHFFGVGIGLAATLQLLGSTNIKWVETPYHPPALVPKSRDCMLTEPLNIDEKGFIQVPQGPGLGIELNEEIIKKYTVK